MSGNIIKIGISQDCPPTDLVRADVVKHHEGIYLKGITPIEVVGSINENPENKTAWEE